MVNPLMETKSLKRAEKTTELLANFVDGFADGWHMALKESFKMELDIKFTERRKDKISHYEWVQGPYYCFSEGQLIYDDRNAYTNWQNALKTVNLACQIVSAQKNIPIKIDNEETGKPEFRVLEGSVKFLLFKPENERTRLVPYVGYNLSQNEFVNFLKTGKL